jgi:flagellar motor component MotA
MIRFLSGIILADLALLGAYIIEGGSPLHLVGLSAFLITFFMPFFGILAVWKFSDWTRAWSHPFVQTDDEAAVKVSIDIWRFSEFASYLAGLVAFLIGLILILGNLTGASTEQIAHAFGAGLVAPMYGLLFGFVSRILRNRVENLHS